MILYSKPYPLSGRVRIDRSGPMRNPGNPPKEEDKEKEKKEFFSEEEFKI